MATERGRDFGSPIAAALILIGAVVVLREATTYVDFDSAVFPRSVAILMIALCLLYIILWLIGFYRSAEVEEPGSWPRRIGLVLIMLASVLLMPWSGFLLSSLIAFALLTLLAMYEPWTMLRTISYSLVGLAIVIGFYVLFAQFLHVPLPVGTLFTG